MPRRCAEKTRSQRAHLFTNLMQAKDEAQASSEAVQTVRFWTFDACQLGG